MVLNTTFNDISVISWQLSLIGGGKRSTCRKPSTVSHQQTLSHNDVYSTPCHELDSNKFSGDRQR